MFVSSYLGDATPAQLEEERFLTKQIAALQSALAQARTRGEVGMPHYVQMEAYLADYRRRVAAVRARNQAADRQTGLRERVGDVQTAAGDVLKFAADTAKQVRDTTVRTTERIGTGLSVALPVAAAGAVLFAYLYLKGGKRVQSNPRRRRRRR